MTSIAGNAKRIHRGGTESTEVMTFLILLRALRASVVKSILLTKQLLDLWLDCRRRGHRGETLYDISLLVHQELGEVPLDAIAQQAALFALQELEDRMRVVAIDLDLREQREVHAVIELTEGLDLVVGARLLMAELIAGKA